MKQGAVIQRFGWTGALMGAVVALMFSAGCAEKNVQKETAGRQAQESTVVQFDQGQAYLSQDAREQLRQAVDDFRENGTIERVSIAVWSDQEFPAEGQELPENQKELAEQRVSNVQEFLEGQLSVSQVQAYNMSEQAGWWASTFNTDEAELKSQFGRQGEAQTDDKTFRVFNQEGQPSSAVVVIEGRKMQNNEDLL